MAQQLHRTPDNPRERQPSQATRGEGGRQESGRQESGGQGNGSQQQRTNNQQRHMLSAPLMAMRGLGQIYDMQITATRLLLQAQASAACAFGWPDYSGLFRIADERAKHVFSSGAEQFMHLADQANQTASEVQRQFGRLLEVQTVHAAETWQRGLEELGMQTEESLEELKEIARQQAEEAMLTAEALSEEARESMRQGGEQFRESVRQGAEQTRQFAAQQGEASREQAERAGGAAREGASQQAAGEEEAQAGQERASHKRRAA